MALNDKSSNKDKESSNDKYFTVPSDFNEKFNKWHLEKEIPTKEFLEQKLKEVASKINLMLIGKLSKELHEHAVELKFITEIISSNPDRRKVYEHIIISRIKNGNKSLKKLIDHLDEAKFFEVFSSLKNNDRFYGLDKSNVTSSEKEFIDFILPDYTSNEVVKRIFNSIDEGKHFNFESVFSEYFNFLSNSENIISKGMPPSKLNGFFKMFAGGAIVGVNISGYIITFGLVMNVYMTFASIINGFVIANDGIEKLKKLDSEAQ